MGKVTPLKQLAIGRKFLEDLSIKVNVCNCGKHSVITAVATLGVRHLVWTISDEYLMYDSDWLRDEFDKRLVKALECSL